jgi:hypothetical protein
LNCQGILKKGAQLAMFTAVGFGGTLDLPPPSITYDDERQYSYPEFQSLRKV